MTTIGFDIYGTLIDTESTAAAVKEIAGDKSDAFVAMWRSKQLEYTFRRTAMSCYMPFPSCTADALDYCCALYNIEISPERRSIMLEQYTALPMFADVVDGLQILREKGLKLFAFSNGIRSDLEKLLAYNGLTELLDGIVSVDEIGQFKPAPDVYRLFNERTGSLPADSWMVSSNPFDIIGAGVYGMNTAWCKRSAANVMDPWDETENIPTVVVGGISELAAMIS